MLKPLHWLIPCLVISGLLYAGTNDSGADEEITGRLVVPVDSIYSGNLLLRGDAEIDGVLAADAHIKEGRLDLGGTIRGDAVLMGSGYRIEGEIDGDLVLFGSQGSVSGSIQGDVILFRGSLALDSAAVIEGSLVNMGAEVSAHPASRIEGDRIELGLIGKMIGGFITGVLSKNEWGTFSIFITPIWGMAVRLIRIALTYLLGLASLYIFPRWQRRSRMLLDEMPWRMVLSGVILRLAIGGIIGILTISIIGLALVPLVILGWLFVAIVAVPQGALWVAGFLKKWWNIKRPSVFALYSLGFVALYLLPILSGVFMGTGVSLGARITGILGYLGVFVVMTLGRGALIYTGLFRRRAKVLERAAND